MVVNGTSSKKKEKRDSVFDGDEWNKQQEKEEERLCL